MRYWLHRISHYHEVSYSLLDNRGILSIGFSDFSDRQFIKDTTDNWDAFEKKIKDSWGWLPRSRHSLWRFLFDMKAGDYVVIPSWSEFQIYEIAEDDCMIASDIDVNGLQDWHNENPIKLGSDNKLYFGGKRTDVVDLGFFRKVKPIITWAARSSFADSALTSRMKTRNTNVNIDDLQEKKSIENAIEAYKNNTPINIYSSILQKTQKTAFSIIKEKLNPDKFEKLIALYFEKAGAGHVEIPSKNEAGKEGDADIIADFEPIKTIIYVQAKFHDDKTNSWAVEQITTFKDSKAIEGYTIGAWVVSTADDFTDECKRLAQDNNVHLVNGMDFTKMLLEIGIKELDSI